MVSLRCCTILVPVLAVLAALAFSFIAEGKAILLIPAWSVEEIPDLTGKVAIVTGPTVDGIGYETAVELARKGAHVIMAGRSKSKGEQALSELKARLPAGVKAEFAELDLASLASVRAFAEGFRRRQLPLHVLVNNAGVMMNPFTLTPDGLESQFATNHLGHFLLTRLLLPVLERSAPARVVTVSSAAAYLPDILAKAVNVLPQTWLPKGASSKLDYSKHLRADSEPTYNPQAAYGRSKLANVLFARALARRVADKKIYSNACNPGGISTNLQRHVLDDISKAGMASVIGMVQASKDALLMEPRQGAVTQLYLATAPEVELKDIRGQFYRPQAKTAKLPSFVSEELEEHLWNISEDLVAKFL